MPKEKVTISQKESKKYNEEPSKKNPILHGYCRSYKKN